MCTVVLLNIYVDIRFGFESEKAQSCVRKSFRSNADSLGPELNGRDETRILTLFTRLLGLTVEYAIKDRSVGEDAGAESFTKLVDESRPHYPIRNGFLPGYLARGPKPQR